MMTNLSVDRSVLTELPSRQGVSSADFFWGGMVHVLFTSGVSLTSAGGSGLIKRLLKHCQSREPPKPPLIASSRVAIPTANPLRSVKSVPSVDKLSAPEEPDQEGFGPQIGADWHRLNSSTYARFQVVGRGRLIHQTTSTEKTQAAQHSLVSSGQWEAGTNGGSNGSEHSLYARIPHPSQ